jgi:hypothetical protein
MNKGFVVLVVLALLFAGMSMQNRPVYAQECATGATINGNFLPNVLNGGPRNNVINGGGGNDTLRGYGCNDRLYGGDGVDMLDGGAGIDECHGGLGNDFFINCEIIVQ